MFCILVKVVRLYFDLFLVDGFIGGTIYGDNMGACIYISILKNRMLETSVHCEHIRVICSHWPFERSR
jgi:hypothetical protein